MMQDDNNQMPIVKILTLAVPTLVVLVTLGMWGCPKYQVYSQRAEGEAILAHSQYSRQVQIQDAQSKMEAAKSLAGAEIERAKGVAQANKIIGDSLKDNESYLRWLYIEGLKERTGTETIYIPTEAGLPILEASRRLQHNSSESQPNPKP